MINIYTEEEAKEKVCPQAVHMLGMSPLINCMGGGCMAWRWEGSLAVFMYKGKNMGKNVPGDIGDPKGYCSLGGKP